MPVTTPPNELGTVGSAYDDVVLIPFPDEIQRKRRSRKFIRGAFTDQHAVIENMGRKYAKRFFRRLKADILERFDALESLDNLRIEQLFEPRLWQRSFNAAYRPGWAAALYAGIQFEADWIGAGASQSTWRMERQEAELPKPPPSFHVDLSAAMQRSINEYLTLRETGVWSQVGATIHNRLRRSIEIGLRDGETLDQMRDRIAATLNLTSASAAERIAMTETTAAMNHGQQIERTEIGIEKKEWISTLDVRTRGADPNDVFDHLSPNGQTVSNEEPFTISGELLMYPGDGSRGASAGNLVNCFLPGTVVQGRFNAAMQSVYRGQAVEIVSRSGAVLRVTKNHPILAEHGFVAAGQLNRGDYLLQCKRYVQKPVRDAVFVASSLVANKNYKPALIEDVFRAFSATEFCELSRTMAGDFHGDGEFLKGDVQIIRPDWKLLRERKSALKEGVAKSNFIRKDSLLSPENGECSLAFLGSGYAPSRTRIPSRAALSLDGRTITFDDGPFEFFSFGPASRIDASLFEHSDDDISGNVVLIRKGFYRATKAKRINQPGDGRQFIRRRFSNAGEPLGGSHVSDQYASIAEPPYQRRVADSDLACKLLTRFAGIVSLDQIVQVRHFNYSGHVFDLQSPLGWILADGIFCSNCRCTSVAAFD
jgi:hypothetical protein